MPTSLTLIRSSSGQSDHDTITVPTLYLTDTAFAAAVDQLAALRQQRDRDREWRHLRERLTAVTRDLDCTAIARTAAAIRSEQIHQLEIAAALQDRITRCTMATAALRRRTTETVKAVRQTVQTARHR